MLSWQTLYMQGNYITTVLISMITNNYTELWCQRQGKNINLMLLWALQTLLKHLLNYNVVLCLQMLFVWKRKPMFHFFHQAHHGQVLDTFLLLWDVLYDDNHPSLKPQMNHFLCSAKCMLNMGSCNLVFIDVSTSDISMLLNESVTFKVFFVFLWELTDSVYWNKHLLSFFMKT